MDQATETKIETKKSDNMKTLVMINLAISVISLLAVLFLFGKLNNITGAAVGVDNGNILPDQLPPQDAGARVKVSVDNDAVRGDKNAPITIIEFSDYQCPFCGRFFQQTLPQIEDNYIKTGKVKIIYRDFPLSFHPEAQKGAEAAECAGEQGKYWEMHDKIFANQDAMSIASYKSWASELKLDANKFNSCLDSGKYASEVQKDFDDGSKAGVSGTPTFFIGNDKDGYVTLVGAQPYQAFQQAIEAELA